MKKLLFSTFLMALACTLRAQLWVEKTFTYDSLLHITYGTATNFNGGIDTLKLDLYWPECPAQQGAAPRPLLLWIHGGAFLAGDKSDPSITRLCKRFAERGYVTASIDYRLGFVSDDAAWSCTYPNYSCVFGADSIEWMRSYYRGIQDGKGALRFLINRHQQYHIDTSNIFVAGESAGAFLALGIGLLDTLPERFPQTFAQADVPAPHPGTQDCVYNVGKIFSGAAIPRPDLGDIDGNIEPTSVQFSVKAIGNMYGGMGADLLKLHKQNTPKPAIFSFHQPCDLVVPFNSGRVFMGLSWCFTHGYNCYGVTNTPIVYGSKAISKWNSDSLYGYTIHNEFTDTQFPYNFVFGAGSCLDQVNNPCHAYDFATLRENQLAAFFADYVSTPGICDSTVVAAATPNALDQITIFPNPARQTVHITVATSTPYHMQILDALGRIVFEEKNCREKSKTIAVKSWASGLYFVLITDKNGAKIARQLAVSSGE